jgi:hypothetical protein
MKQLASNPNIYQKRAQNNVYIANIVAQEVDRFIASEKLSQRSLTNLGNKIEKMLLEDPYFAVA